MPEVTCCCGERISGIAGMCDDCARQGCRFGYCERIESGAINT